MSDSGESDPSESLPQKVNYVFVDFENVQKIDLSIIGLESVYFTLLIGISGYDV